MKLPPLSGKEVLKILTNKLGYSIIRSRGSHFSLYNPNPRWNGEKMITVILHSNRPLKRGTLKGIIDDTGLTIEEFEGLR